jgi:hypothetical protein
MEIWEPAQYYPSAVVQGMPTQEKWTETFGFVSLLMVGEQALGEKSWIYLWLRYYEKELKMYGHIYHKKISNQPSIMEITGSSRYPRKRGSDQYTFR